MNAKDAVRRVLNQASKAAHFFDLSERERITYLIERAFKLGVKTARTKMRPLLSDEDDAPTVQRYREERRRWHRGISTCQIGNELRFGCFIRSWKLRGIPDRLRQMCM